MRISDEQYESMRSAMETAGAEAGRNSGAWWEQEFGRRCDNDDARRVIKGIDDGDPEILDSLPMLDLSGQWADGLRPWDIYHDVSAEDWPSFDDCTDIDTLIDAYRDAHDGAVVEVVYAYCESLTRG